MTLLSLPDPRHAWLRTFPFRHLRVPVMDRKVAAAIADEFPPPSSSDWYTFHNGPHEDGKQEGQAFIAGPLVAEVHREYERLVTPWLATVFGFPDLLPDPEQTGGGIHQSGPGARLGLHTDFNVHPSAFVLRAVNVILFLTDTYGQGQLVLRNADTDDETYVNPTPGELVAFECVSYGYHGHPIPMGADAPLRKTIPGYWYRPPREGETIMPRSTEFLDA